MDMTYQNNTYMSHIADITDGRYSLDEKIMSLRYIPPASCHPTAGSPVGLAGGEYWPDRRSLTLLARAYGVAEPGSC